MNKNTVGAAMVAALVALPAATHTPQVPVAAKDATIVVDPAGGTLDLTWATPTTPRAYLIVDDRTHEVIWTGDQPRVSLPVASPTSHELLIASLDEDDVELVAKVVATLPPTDSTLTPITMVTDTHGSTISWGALGSADLHDVYVDGDLRERTTSTTVHIPHGLRDTASVEIVSGAGAALTTTYGIELTAPTTDLSTIDATTGEGDVLAAGLTRIVRSRTVYEPYIPMAYVDAPERNKAIDCEAGDGKSDYWYAGDNRQVGFNTGKYKTRAVGDYFWDTKSLGTGKNVSTTRRYRKVGTSYEFVDKRLADSNGFHVREISNDGRYGRIVIEHEVGNPYCTPLAGITYANQQDLYQDGSHWIYGAHDKMPNHQQHRQNFYSDGTNKVELIFNHKMKDPNCLWALRPDCGSEQYQYVK